ncbi:EamA family transporter [Candidatus Bipolaricaulota bacterium]|nr:EamA family transporter [Candidatus Bipolaricaulota bacterium]
MGNYVKMGALAEILLVAAIWSSSFVGVKVALRYIGPLTVAGLRYFLAFLLLAPWLRSRHVGLSPRVWRRLTAIGLAQYVVGNGALFYSLQRLPATAGSLSLSLVPIVVLLLEAVRLRERPGLLPGLGVALGVGGSFLFFSPSVWPKDLAALGALGIAILAFSVWPVMGREMAHGREVGTIPLTAIPLGLGGGVLLILALAVEGLPRMPLLGWGVVLGLAAINTALAYLLYAHALQHLTATQANVILNLSPLGTAVISWPTLGERIKPVQYLAIVIIIVGVAMVQMRKDLGSR